MLYVYEKEVPAVNRFHAESLASVCWAEGMIAKREQEGSFRLGDGPHGWAVGTRAGKANVGMLVDGETGASPKTTCLQYKKGYKLQTRSINPEGSSTRSRSPPQRLSIAVR